MAFEDVAIAITVINFGRISHNVLFLLVKFSKIDGNESTFVHEAFGDNGGVGNQPKAFSGLCKVSYALCKFCPDKWNLI